MEAFAQPLPPEEQHLVQAGHQQHEQPAGGEGHEQLPAKPTGGLPAAHEAAAAVDGKRRLGELAAVLLLPRCMSLR